METNNFALHNGQIVYVENPPERNFYAAGINSKRFREQEEVYEQALKSAIANGIEVENFDETEDALLDAHATGHGFRLEENKLYPLQCRVEKDIKYTPIGRGLHYKIEGDDTLRQADLVRDGIGYMAKEVARVTFDEQVETRKRGMLIQVEFKDHNKIVLTNPHGDTYTSRSEELMNYSIKMKHVAEKGVLKNQIEQQKERIAELEEACKKWIDEIESDDLKAFPLSSYKKELLGQMKSALNQQDNT
jgi:hypothetical protein